MKKILLAVVLATLGYYAFPQDIKNSVATVNPEVAPLSGSAAALNTSTTDAKNVSSKAVKNFNKTFKKLTGENPSQFRKQHTLN